MKQNKNILNESSLSRLLVQYESDFPFVIMSANKADKTKKENTANTKSLIRALNMRKMGPHKLIGYWLECPHEGMSYEDCPKEDLVSTKENSVFVSLPKGMKEDEFLQKLLRLGRAFKQNGILYGTKTDGVFFIDCSDGSRTLIGKKLSLGKISQGYSLHMKKQNVPFMFE